MNSVEPECEHWDKILTLKVDNEFLKGTAFIKCEGCGFEFNNPMWLSRYSFQKGKELQRNMQMMKDTLQLRKLYEELEILFIVM